MVKDDIKIVLMERNDCYFSQKVDIIIKPYHQYYILQPN